ncbi:MAG: hypothetical protein WCS27_08280 [Victivallaceae bacterium]
MKYRVCYKILFVFLGCVLLLVLAACRAAAPEDRKYLPVANNFVVYDSWTLGPRGGFKLNSGRKLSFMENWSATPVLGIPAKFVNAVIAGTGVTETQFTFDNRLDPAGSKFNQELLMTLYQRKLISREQAVEYLEKNFRDRQLNSDALENMCRLQVPVKTELLKSNMLFNNWYSESGFTPEISRYFLQASENNNVLVRKRIKENLSLDIINILPVTVIQAENMKLISRKEADLILKLRFMEISRQVVHARMFSQPNGHINSGEIRKFKLAEEIASFHVGKVTKQLENIRNNETQTAQ